MYYIAIWGESLIGVSDNIKDIDFYVHDIRGLKDTECSIQEIDDESLEFYKENIFERELFFVEVGGIMIPQMMVTIINNDLRHGPVNVLALLHSLTEFTKLMINSEIISDESDKKALMKSLKIVSKINSKSQDVYSDIEENHFFMHPALTCSYTEYLDYIRYYDSIKEMNRLFDINMMQPYT